MKNANRSILSKEYVADILVFLIGKSVICGDLDAVVKSPTTRRDTMIKLRDAGLVRIDVILKPRRTYRVTLTPLGEHVAKLLKEADDILSGREPVRDDKTNHSTPETVGADVTSGKT